MDGCVCAGCHALITSSLAVCPSCETPLVFEGADKNIIDRLEPNCLIHRYEGSDMLEPAVLLKVAKTNAKVATKLREYAQPVTVPKHKVYAFDQPIYSKIQALRNERTATIGRYDQLIQSHWQHLKPYTD
jgi:RNA polymerase subunit RPABC4/transcription elongation factor Spt4